MSSSLNGKEQGQDALATKAKRLFANTKGSVRIPDPKTIHLRLPEPYFEPQTLLRFMKKMFADREQVIHAARIRRVGP